MSKGGYEYCFYCNALVNVSAKGDHFPIPKRLGGEEVVPCCGSCHSMKDRRSLIDWPLEWMMVVYADIPKMSRETKIFLAKSVALFHDAARAIKNRPARKDDPARVDRAAKALWSFVGGGDPHKLVYVVKDDMEAVARAVLAAADAEE